MTRRQSARRTLLPVLLGCLAGPMWMLVPCRPCSAQPAANQAAVSDRTDIKGPVGLLEYPEEPPTPWKRRALGGSLATGFAAMGLALLRRRRRRIAERRRNTGVGELRALEKGLDDLPAGDFYERLLAIVRRSLDHLPGRRAVALTPRQLAESDFGAGESEAESWRDLCVRAERAEYGRADFEGERRRNDLQLVREMLGRLHREPRAEEAADGL